MAAKILYVTQEIFPYLPASEVATLSRELPQAIQEMGKEIRTFMPRYGCINERRNQLHEVIRLSGMNLIIDDTDHQLIIKVASIQAARMQVYFIDNEEYFRRKAIVTDENGVEFADNDDRMVFFARGVLETVKKLLSKMQMTLNPKKVEQVYKDKWVKFLGFNIKGEQITLSATRVKSFQKEIASRTIKQRNVSFTKAVNSVNNFLYKGDGRYSWATSVLPIINVEKDIETLNTFIMDAIRSCATNKKKIGGLGSVNDKYDYTILRGIGKNVSANRVKTEKEIAGFFTLKCMQNALLTSHAVYETLVRMM